ncbi:MAG: hypothetical protein AAFS10_24580, partial [Myxococcota bacterium]
GAWTESDGILIEDVVLPEITRFEMTPLLLTSATEEPLTWIVEARDNVGLATVTVTLRRDGAQTPVVEVSRPQNGAMEVALMERVTDDALMGVLEDGEYTATVEVLDQGGNRATTAAELVVLRTLPPTPTLTSPEDGALLAESTVEIAGEVPPTMAQLTVLVDEEVLCVVDPVPEEGVFACTAEALGDGEHMARAEAEDGVGNRSVSPPHTFVVDTTAPDAPVLTAPIDGAVVNDAAVGVEGTAEANAVVAVWADGATEEPLCTVNASPEGAFGCELLLDDGTFMLVAEATDAAGNRSELSEPVAVTVMATVMAMDTGMVVTDDVEPMPDTVEDEPDVETMPDVAPDTEEEPEDKVVRTGGAEDGCGCSMPGRPVPAWPWGAAVATLGWIVAVGRRR